MKTNILIVMFSLLLAVHVIADCASNCADAYKAALDKCTEEYTKAMKQCSDVYDNVYNSAKNEKWNTETKCWDAYNGALDRYRADLQVTDAQCRDNCAKCIKTAEENYEWAMDLCDDAPCQMEAWNTRKRVLAECRDTLDTCLDDNEDAYDEDCAAAKVGLDDCLEGADIVYGVAMADALVVLVACRATAMATSVACIASAKNTYEDCVAGCGG